jgi:hypothetical protein
MQAIPVLALSAGGYTHGFPMKRVSAPSQNVQRNWMTKVLRRLANSICFGVREMWVDTLVSMNTDPLSPLIICPDHPHPHHSLDHCGTVPAEIGR